MATSHKSPITTGRLLTIVFGALPATLMSIPASYGVGFGAVGIIAGLFNASAEAVAFGAVVLLWGGLGIHGMLALWAVGLSGRPEGWVRTGLTMGTVAIFPLCVFAVVGGLTSQTADLLGALLLVPPPIIAICWLIAFGRRPLYRDHGLIDSTNPGAARGIAR